MRERALRRGQRSYVFELVAYPARDVIGRDHLVDGDRSLASLGLAHLQRAVHRPGRDLDVERVHAQRFDTIRQAKDEVLDWLLWYNQTRMHSTLGYVSPMQFEQDWYRSTAAVAN